MTIVVEETYNVTYDLAGGKLEGENPTVYYDSKCPYSLVEPTKDAYTFAGWVDEEGNIYYNIPAGTNKDLALTATWEPIVYSLLYVLNGGQVEGAEVPTYDKLVELFLADYYANSNLKPEEYKDAFIAEGHNDTKTIFLYNNLNKWGWLIDWFIQFASESNLIGLNAFQQYDNFWDLNTYDNGLDIIPAELMGFVSGEKYTSTDYNEWGTENPLTSIDFSQEAVKEVIKDYVAVEYFTVETEDFEVKKAYKYGYDFTAWYDDVDNTVEKVEKGTWENLSVYPKYDIVTYKVYYWSLAGGEWPIADLLTSNNIYVSFKTQFFKDLGEYAGYTSSLELFHNHSKDTIKYLFSKSYMLDRYQWLLEYILSEFEENAATLGLTQSTIATETIELLNKLIAGDTTAINGSYANGRTMLRYYIHCILNGKKLQNVQDTGDTYSKYVSAVSYETEINNLFDFVKEYDINTPAFELLTPIRPGYKFVGWVNHEWVNYKEIYTEPMTTLAPKDFCYFINLQAKWEKEEADLEPNEYSITYVLNDGYFNDMDSLSDWRFEFISDYKTAAGSTANYISSTNFHVDTKDNIKLAFANAEFLAKYKTFFEYMLEEIKANAIVNNFTLSSNKYTQVVELLGKLIAGDTTAINGNYAEGRTIIRHFIHNLLNENHESAGTTKGAYLKLTSDFSDPNVVKKFVKQFVKTAYYYTTTSETIVLPSDGYKLVMYHDPSLPATWYDYYKFTGWYTNPECTGEPVTEIPTGSTGNITLYAGWELILY